jgi:hypothetical protein
MTKEEYLKERQKIEQALKQLDEKIQQGFEEAKTPLEKFTEEVFKYAQQRFTVRGDEQVLVGYGKSWPTLEMYSKDGLAQTNHAIWFGLPHCNHEWSMTVLNTVLDVCDRYKTNKLFRVTIWHRHDEQKIGMRIYLKD